MRYESLLNKSKINSQLDKPELLLNEYETKETNTGVEMAKAKEGKDSSFWNNTFDFNSLSNEETRTQEGLEESISKGLVN